MFGPLDCASSIGDIVLLEPVQGKVCSIKRRPHEQVSPWQVSVDKFYLLVCVCVGGGGGEMASFSLTNCLVQKLECQLFNKETVSTR